MNGIGDSIFDFITVRSSEQGCTPRLWLTIRSTVINISLTNNKKDLVSD